MVIRGITMKRLRIPFREAFKHASAERAETYSVWVEASDQGHLGYGEACPREYVTGETLASVYRFFSTHRAAICDEIVDLKSLRTWVTVHAVAIDANPAAWCAIELAILDLLAKLNQQTLESLLSLPPLSGGFRYSAVLGDANMQTFRASVERYVAYGFTDYKIKLSGDLHRDRNKLALLKDLGGGAYRIRVDANNLWNRAEEAIPYIQALDCPLFAIEEPIGSNQYADLLLIADALACRIVLDESFLRVGQFVELAGNHAAWLVNLRVSKMGGLLRSLKIIESARLLKIELVIGAQVGETSLLTRAALTVANVAKDILAAQEGGFGTFLLQQDLFTPSLMYGSAGVLETDEYPELIKPGLGIEPVINPSLIETMDTRYVDGQSQ